MNSLTITFNDVLLRSLHKCADNLRPCSSVCGCVCVVFGGGTTSFKEVRSSWFVSEEVREAAVNHQSLNMKVRHTLICFFFLCEYSLWISVSLACYCDFFFFISLLVSSVTVSHESFIWLNMIIRDT